MTTKILSSVIVAAVLAGSAAAAVQVMEPAFASGPVSTKSVSVEPTGPDAALPLLRLGATRGNLKQGPNGIVRIAH